MKFSIQKFVLMIIVACWVASFYSCQKDEDPPQPPPGLNLSLDSIVATKTNIVVWEEIYITAFASGAEISYKWQTNHGSMVGIDSTTVLYWACPTCVGRNTVKCTISNNFGTISDTITINVTP